MDLILVSTGKDTYPTITDRYKPKIIDFYSMDMADLTFVAKNRALPLDTFFVMDGNKVVARIVVGNSNNIDKAAAAIDKAMAGG